MACSNERGLRHKVTAGPIYTSLHIDPIGKVMTESKLVYYVKIDVQGRTKIVQNYLGW